MTPAISSNLTTSSLNTQNLILVVYYCSTTGDATARPVVHFMTPLLQACRRAVVRIPLEWIKGLEAADDYRSGVQRAGIDRGHGIVGASH
jgi:hypothetical protein